MKIMKYLFNLKKKLINRSALIIGSGWGLIKQPKVLSWNHQNVEIEMYNPSCLYYLCNWSCFPLGSNFYCFFISFPCCCYINCTLVLLQVWKDENECVTLPHKVKTQYLLFRLHSSYFLFFTLKGYRRNQRTINALPYHI